MKEITSDQMSISENKVVDYVYLLRKKKFRKSGLISLFMKPEMQITKFQEYDNAFLAKSLLGKKASIDGFSKIDQIRNFDFADPEYFKIIDLVADCRNNNIDIITPFSDNIPSIFRDIKPSYRDLIFMKGSITQDDERSYSICGTRNPTSDAIVKTQKIGAFFAQKGITLINGFARGIDIEAYKGAKFENGRYIAVLASGIQNIYPPEHKRFENLIKENGALISQRFPNKRVNRVSLQMRNRFSAQLSTGSIFIEGTYKSGTKWQYKFAKELDRLIFYLEPKDWHHQNSHIPNLIREQGGVKIQNDLSNLEEIYELFMQKWRKKGILENDS